MLKAAGVVLVVFSCAGLGCSKKAALSRRIAGLREIEKLLLLLEGEITYRKEALPEALLRVADKVREPFSGFLKEVSGTASLYQGERFSCIFREKVQEYLKNSGMDKKDLEEFAQLGEYLGYLDISVQKNTMALYLEELKHEREEAVRELPIKARLYQSMGLLGGMFLAVIFC